jgi:hypothetical protein
MSHYMTALAMQQRGLKPAAKVVLYWLADHHNGETGACFPSLNTLANECEMDRSTVVRHLEALEAGGLIERDKRTRANGSQTSTAYILTMTPVAKYNSPCCKTPQPPVVICDPLNLGTINLGSEQETTNVVLAKPHLHVDNISEAVTCYNDAADRAGWPKMQKLSPARRQALNGRLKDADGIAGWEYALSKAEASSFLTGRTSKPFLASFDFITKAANFIKIVEGNYDDKPNSGTNRTANGTGAGRNSFLDEIAAAARS